MKKNNVAPRKGNYRDRRIRKVLVKLTMLITVIVFPFLSGCSSFFTIGGSDYGCSGMPEGVRCMSSRDVYAATNDGNIPRPMMEEKSSKGDKKKNPNKYSSSVNPVIDNYVAPNLPDKPIPIRTPAQVMRIWVAPWEDKNGDLIVPGYVYTEIEPRRWVIGDGAPESEPILRPLKAVK